MAQIILCGGISFVATYMRPVGVFQIANVLRNAGYTVQVIDSWPFIAERGYEVAEKVLKHFVTKDTLWIGFGSTWLSNLRVPKSNLGTIYSSSADLVDNTYIFTDDELAELKKSVKSVSPNCKFVLGGGRAPIGRLGIRPGFIDCFIEGYGDSTAIEFTKYCEGKNPFLPITKNIDNSISLTHDHKASTFDYNNHKFTWHENDLVQEGEALPMEIARGCIFNCNFCAYPLNGRKKLDYLKNPSIILEQLEENYSRFKTTHYWFLDDTFNDSVEKLEILHDQVFSKLSFKINFNAFMRLDLINAHPQTLDILKASGCGGFSFGIESLNYEAVKSIGKGITRDKVYNVLSRIQTEMPDALVDSQFIIGLPHETRATLIDWITEITDPAYPLHNAKVHALSINPYPGYENIWQSNFEKYPEKYGYTFPIPSNRSFWVNNKGFSKKSAVMLQEELKDRLKYKEGDAWLGYVGMQNMGLSKERTMERLGMQRKDRLAADKLLRNKFTTRYIENLLKLDPQ